jgi:hypothetical protein
VANVEGKATAITVLTPVRRGGPLLLWLVFWAGRNITETLQKLQTLSFIHYARWAVIERFPDQGEGERLQYSYLLFESNFNGTWDQYIDAFAQVMPARFKFFWGSSYNFPGPMPTGPFREWVRRHHYPVGHYYAARPDGTATVVLSALALERQLRQFARESAGWDAATFKTRYDALLCAMEADL